MIENRKIFIFIIIGLVIFYIPILFFKVKNIVNSESDIKEITETLKRTTNEVREEFDLEGNPFSDSGAIFEIDRVLLEQEQEEIENRGEQTEETETIVEEVEETTSQ